MYNNSFSNSFIIQKNSFSFIRLICCLIVIYEHSVALSHSAWINLHLAPFAVKTFFILSGFWVTFSLLKSSSIKEYTKKRLIKIFPKYWAVIIFTAFSFVFVSSFSVKKYFLDAVLWKYIFVNFMTLNFLQPSLPGVFEGLPFEGAVNGALWTIKIELCFYLFLPIIFFVLFKVKEKLKCKNGESIILIIIFISSVCFSCVVEYFCLHYNFSQSLKTLFPAFLTYFISGMIFCLYWKIIEKNLNKMIIPSFVLLFLVNYFDIRIVPYIITPIALSIVVIWFATRLVFAEKIMHYDYSYEMYLVHYPLVMLFVQYNFFENNFCLAFFAVIGLTFLFSYVLKRTFEIIIKL